MKKLAVIIPTKDRPDELSRLLEYVYTQAKIICDIGC